FFDHRVERAGLTAVAPEHTLNIEGCCIETLRDTRHFRSDHKEEDRIGINEAADQPRARDAVDLGPAPRDPQSPAFLIARRNLLASHQRLTGLLPGFTTTWVSLYAGAHWEIAR